jgi:hypothetical protein
MAASHSWWQGRNAEDESDDKMSIEPLTNRLWTSTNYDYDYDFDADEKKRSPRHSLAHLNDQLPTTRFDDQKKRPPPSFYHDHQCDSNYLPIGPNINTRTNTRNSRGIGDKINLAVSIANLAGLIGLEVT